MASPSGHGHARADEDAASRSSEQPTGGEATASRPRLIGDRGDAVAFLDAPGLGARELLDAVDRVLATMPDGAILTAFTDDPTAPHIAPAWCTGRHVELLAVIPHGVLTGTTLTFRRAEPGSGPDGTGPSQF